jgi:hypothetical protein
MGFQSPSRQIGSPLLRRTSARDDHDPGDSLSFLMQAKRQETTSAMGTTAPESEASCHLIEIRSVLIFRLPDCIPRFPSFEWMTGHPEASHFLAFPQVSRHNCVESVGIIVSASRSNFATGCGKIAPRVRWLKRELSSQCDNNLGRKSADSVTRIPGIHVLSNERGSSFWRFDEPIALYCHVYRNLMIVGQVAALAWPE